MKASKQAPDTMYSLLTVGALAMALGPLAAPLLDPGANQSHLAGGLGQLENPLAMHDTTRNLPEGATGKQLLDIAASAGSLDVFGSVIQAAGDAGLLDANGPITLFMPVDEAFSSMTGEQLSALLNDSDSLQSFVKTYIVPGHLSATDLMSDIKVVSLAGDEIATRVGSEIQVNDANVIATEVAQDGVVHYVDRLL